MKVERQLDKLFMTVYYHRGYKTFNNSDFELLKGFKEKIEEVLKMVNTELKERKK